jgi:hypothetical protein
MNGTVTAPRLLDQRMTKNTNFDLGVITRQWFFRQR